MESRGGLGVPRPPVLARPKIVPIVFEESIYSELKRVAASRGVSVSSLIREIVVSYLQSVNPRATGSAPSDPPPGSKIDPVVLADIEDLEEELSVLEKIVSGVESNLLKIGNPSGPIYGAIVRQQLEKLDEAESRLRRIRQAYYRLRRQGRGDERLTGLASRIYSLNKRVKGLREKWRRQWRS
jgi:hypothetical protein